MTSDEYLAAIARDGPAFADAAEAAGLEAAVTACPGWSVADLVWHLAEVHYFWRWVVAEKLAPDAYQEPDRPADDDLLAWYRAGVDRLVETLRDNDPATEVWTWAPQKDVAFVQRRQAHETAVHRRDAEDAAGRKHDLEPVLAADGVDEFLTFMIGGRAGAEPVGGTVHLHCTDTPGEWFIRPAADGTLVVTREHAKGDVAIRGAASDLDLVLWRRIGLDAVDIIGDKALAQRFIAKADLE